MLIKRGSLAASSNQQVGTTLASKLVPYLFIAPFVLTFLAFFAAPFGYSVVLSLFRYRGFGPMRFVGLQNYGNLLRYPDFWLAVRNTFFYFFAHFIPSMGLSFIAAYLLYSGFISPRATRVYKAVLFFPRVVAVVAAALVFRVLLATRTGAINALLGTEIPFLHSHQLFRWSVVGLIVWRQVGWFMVVYLAGLTTINDDIHDSVQIDGAGPLQKLWYVVLPLMKPIFLFCFVMDTIGSMKLFTEPSVLSTGVMAPQVRTMVAVLARNVTAGNYGMAAATGWILFVITLLFTWALLTVFKRSGANS